jgi:hypothetical protein
MNSDEINQIFENAKQDPSLFSTMDIENLLDTIENEANDYLENKTTQDIANKIMEELQEAQLSNDEIEKMYKKLLGYRLVDEIYELHKGKHVRWLRKQNKKLTNGGIVVDIKFLDKGIQVLCVNSKQRFIQYKFDECITFQKLSTEEQLILMAYEHIHS